MNKINFTPFPILETKRLILRRLSIDDDNEILKIRSDERVNKYLDRKACAGLDEARQFINRINEGILNNESIYWAVSLKENPKLIGTICLWNISEEETKADIGFELLPEFQGKGIMQEAVSSVIDFGFSKMGLKIIEGEVAPENNKSVNLLRKFNFKPKEDYTDKENIKVAVYKLLKDEIKF